MLSLRFFRQRSFSAPIGSLGLAMFGLVGALFVLTQFLQFNLGYSPLEAGVRMLPMAGAMAVVAPLSSIAVRHAGTKLTVAAGLLLIAAGLWQTSHATVTWTFVSVLPGLILAGVGAALVIPAVSGSVMNSLPQEHTGVGSATNGVFIQIGGALGVAVVGSLLSTRYQDRMVAALARHQVPPAIETTITGSVGGALGVAAHVGGSLGRLLTEAARSAFLSGGNLGLFTAAMVVLAGCVLALVTVPGRPRPAAGRSAGNVSETASSVTRRTALSGHNGRGHRRRGPRRA
jgi:hypothetical protein